jgi:branched-chain amino acid transport system substrate-binding protein
MLRRTLLKGTSAVALAAVTATGAFAQDNTVKIGLILPLTGPFASNTGRQIENSIKAYMAQNGDTVAGKKIQLIIKDDASTADTTKRLAQELVVNDKVHMIAGFGLTPLALAAAPIADEAKIPMIVMAAATSVVTERSNFIVRTSFPATSPVPPLADWASKNGIKKTISLVADFAPGHDIEKGWDEFFTKAGGQVMEKVRIPLRNPDFAPFLQRVQDAKPDALFVFTPAGMGAQFMKQYVERGMDKSGIRLIATGDVTDDEVLNSMGDVALGVINAHHYSAHHKSPENAKYREAYAKVTNGGRPNFMGVGGYDGIHLIYEALKKTGGNTDGAGLVAAMKGMKWMSPRGPIEIDAETRDVIHNIYIRKVEKADGELYNVEFATVENVKDPVKAAKK